jgi:hypothetical protein
MEKEIEEHVKEVGGQVVEEGELRKEKMRKTELKRRKEGRKCIAIEG